LGELESKRGGGFEKSTGSQAEEKVADVEVRPPGLKPALSGGLYAALKAPLFHGGAHISEFFRSLFGRVPLKCMNSICSFRSEGGQT
jgi:hypothetical protein